MTDMRLPLFPRRITIVLSVIASPAVAGRGDLDNNMQTNNQYFIYIISNDINTVLYIGVTNNLAKRIYEHKNKVVSSFSSKYNLNKLVYYEVFPHIELAIAREKQLKAGSRKKKDLLIQSINPKYEDLYYKICG